jgi:hypothetical protein
MIEQDVAVRQEVRHGVTRRTRLGKEDVMS